MLFSASDEENLIAKNFSKNFNLDDSGISFPVFPSGTNLKMYISVLSVLNKVLEKLVNNRIVNQLEKCDLFTDFHYNIRFSRSTADLMIRF